MARFIVGWLLVYACLVVTTTVGWAQDEGPTPAELANLPGGTLRELGDVQLSPYELGDGPECEKGTIVVPENRQSATSRNIELHFYRFKARRPSGRAPVFMVPGGPGGFYNDDWVNGLRSKPSRGSNLQAWNYAETRDVVLVNQRGARFPDRRYQFFGFIFPPQSLSEPFSESQYREKLQRAASKSLENWSQRGLDPAGYDIMNMVEDINDLRAALGYEKVALRGTSFGSQWSFSYIRKYPEFVDRAVLSGTEPIDYGYDSPQGIWNVFVRLEQRLEAASSSDNSLQLPEISVTEAIQQIVERLESEPVKIELDYRGKTRAVTIGLDDFRRELRSGIGSWRGSTKSLENFPKFIFEIWQEDYRYLASKMVDGRRGFQGGSLQQILIDNSLGISASRDAQLDAEAPRQWLGELNLVYKATRDVTPTPVVPDSWRLLKTEVPILLVHGDLDLSTPIENAEEALPHLANAHLIRVAAGTHGAFDQAADHAPEFNDWILKFLAADFTSDPSITALDLPTEISLPSLQFASMTGPSLFDKRVEETSSE